MNAPATTTAPAPDERPPEVIDFTKGLVIRQKDGGEIRQFKTRVTLATVDDTLVALPGTGMNIVSATGYNLMARMGGLMVVNANTVVVDGTAQSNPHVKRNARGHIEQVTCRAMCFGYSPLGIPTVSDRTVTFDLGLYRIQDLIAKAKGCPAAFKLVPVGTELPAACWARYSLDEAVDMLVDTSSTEAINWYSNINSRQKKAVEFAQTFAQRNAIKSHPNVTIHKVKGNTTIQTTMSVWRPVKGSMQWDMTGFAGQVELIEALADGRRQIAPTEGSPAPQVLKGSNNKNDDQTAQTDLAVVEPEEHQSAPAEEKAENANPDSPIDADLERWAKEDPTLFATVASEVGTGADIWWTEEPPLKAKLHEAITNAHLKAQGYAPKTKKAGGK